MGYRSIFTFAFVLNICGLFGHTTVMAQSISSNKCSKDGPTDYYYVPAQASDKQSYRLKLLYPYTINEDRYTATPVHINLRPINTMLSIPANLMQKFIRRCALPYAEQYWDLVFLEALLPNFSPRTIDNEKQFSQGRLRSQGASIDQLTIKIGSLTSETSHRYLESKVKAGRLELISEKETYGLKEFRDPKRTLEPFRTSFMKADSTKLKTPSGNPIIYRCNGNGSEKSIEEQRCESAFVISAEHWPKEQKELFGRVSGLEVRYWFYRKHLSSWHIIHNRIVQMVDEYLLDVSFAP